MDAVVAKDMAARHTPGASVAVIKDGKVVFEKSYGLASVELNVPATNATLYPLASTTKEFTAVAIMTLVEQGKIALDDPVRKYLPELPASWLPVTIRHCLSHTSGLPDNVVNDTVNVLPLAGTRAELMTLLARKPVKAPGASMTYNQTGYMLLGDIIARVSGMPYEKYIDDRLLKPLGITGLRWGDTWTLVPGRASLYTALQPTADHSKLQLDANSAPVLSTDGIHPFGSKIATEWLLPAAGLSGNIEAMSTWENALWNGRIIKPESLALMAKPYVMTDGKTGDFGLALMHDSQQGHVTIHTGGGAAVWITTIPDRHLTVIVLTNLQASQPYKLVASILDVYLGSQH
ncbi:serine hydrolase domain-containing protein [Luteibacter sp. ME-Dv--P-043b]|uniref:serine hydrolase domain-containing protein n=1 Tax=Luteibacter sp. ME-Dv--P-043b TaxID=3040291 RepID=UPI0025560FE8|nr:serine hydrolase domain-containing protein [Luteibacter sp. ME-Dv--P-043b]